MQLVFQCTSSISCSYTELHLLEHVLLSRLPNYDEIQAFCIEVQKLSLGNARIDQVTLRTKIILSFSDINDEACTFIRKNINSVYFTEVDILREKRALSIERIHYDSSKLRYYDKSQDSGFDTSIIKGINHGRLCEIRKSLHFFEIKNEEKTLTVKEVSRLKNKHRVPTDTWYVMSSFWFHVYVSRFSTPDQLRGSLFTIISSVDKWYGTVFAHYTDENEISLAKPWFLTWEYVEKRMLSSAEILKWVQQSREGILKNNGYDYFFLANGFVDVFAYYSDEEIVGMVVNMLKETFSKMKKTKNMKVW